jgi:hypothetical protein
MKIKWRERKMKVFEVNDSKVTGVQVAQMFGETFEVPRKVKFIGYHTFRFIGGVLEYEIRMTKSGFEINRNS